MTQLTRFVFLAFLASLTAVPAPGRAQDISRVIALDALAGTDPFQALQQVDIALRDPLVLGTPPKMRILVDLMQLRADLLDGLGYVQAADAWADLARTRAFARTELGEDPVPAFLKAADIYESQGAIGSARTMIEAAITAEEETGRGDAVLRDLYAELIRLAELMGDDAAADRARAAFEALASPSLETSFAGDDDGFHAVDVYYATDRARSGDSHPARFYGGERGDRLELGIATVTIPSIHVAGQVEKPSIWRLEFRANPSKHILLKSVEPVDPDSFYGRLQDEFQEDGQRDLLVFIHGYNTSFEYAAQRTAQMVHDMGDGTVPVLFSWPSRDTTIGYNADAAVVRLSGRRLARFLEDLVLRSGARSINVVAHSMGNRALTDALEIMALRRDARPGDQPILDQVMFAAPDVDAELFGAMAGTFAPLAQRMTLYASSTDWALVSSGKLHGSAPRAGLGGDVILAHPAFDSIDMTSLGDDMLAHNYFSNDSSALVDIMTLFWRDVPPERRCGLQARPARDGTVWEYREGVCPSNDLIGVISYAQSRHLRTSNELRTLVADLLSEESRVERVMSVLDQILDAVR
ncbi:alpha/beta hydrolase [Mameliella sp. CS4]|uniref:alpha/beta hydrolase n=1 Tax=Mameliella sp. CS4 TaxID=2862329 RepID=UPI001C5EB6C6|nr:alpha/beta hydrolase [Mameliella sp. CS4]MBW4984624.1 alpha/beta hydrolase [Mameliella sp. CS4]